eukprot:jgi/Orpsp1_1/1178854/evm.model.c7180000066966.1
MTSVDLTTENSIQNKETNLKLMECTDGTCTSKEGYVTDGSNYSEISSTGSVKVTLETACSGKVGKLMTGGTLCIDEVDGNAVAIATDTNSYLIQIGSDHYLFKGATKIFTKTKVTGINSGLNIINVNDGTITTSVTNETVVSIALFNCNTNKTQCKQTYGYLKSGSNYYSIGADGTNANASSAVSTDCGSGNTAKIKSDGTLCIVGDTDPSTGTMTAGNIYIVSAPANSVFNADTTNAAVVLIKSTANAYYYDNLYSGDAIVLTGAGTKIESTGITDANKAKLQAFTCDATGVCTQVAGFVTDGTNYYQLKASAVAGDITSTVASTTTCTTAGSLYSDGKLCLTTDVKDAISFSSDSEKTEYYMTGTYFLVTAKKNLFIIGTTAAGRINAGLNIINVNDGTITTSVTDETVVSIALFNCNTDKTQCKQTYGYLKSGSYYYSIGAGGNNAEIASGDFSTACGSGDTAKIKSDGTLCIVGDNSAPSTGTMTAGNIYIVSAPASGVFSSSASVILIKSTDNAYYYDNLYSGDAIVLTGAGTKIESTGITDANKAKLQAFTCDATGVCTQVAGFVTDGTNYYQLKASAVADDITSTVATTCTTAGSLYSDGKLCLTTDVKDAISFSSDSEKTEYYMTGTYFLVTAKKNLFIIGTTAAG